MGVGALWAHGESTHGLGNELVTPGSVRMDDLPENPQLIRVVSFPSAVPSFLLSHSPAYPISRGGIDVCSIATTEPIINIVKSGK